MNRYLLFFIAFLCINSKCTTKTQTKESDQLEQIDSITTRSDEIKKPLITLDQSDEERKKFIQGRWAISKEANISFRVVGDSLYFFEDSIPVYFEIKYDSFIYFIDDEKYFNRIIKLQRDSIVFIENGELIRLYKRGK